MTSFWRQGDLAVPVGGVGLANHVSTQRFVEASSGAVDLEYEDEW